MDIIRDLLDAQVKDRKGRLIGRVDGIVLDMRAGEAPAVAAIEIGPLTVLRRIHPALGNWFERLGRRFGFDTRPVRIDIEHVRNVDVDVRLDLLASDEPALLRFEQWARTRFVDRIGGAAR